MAEQDNTTAPQEYDVFSIALGNDLWDVHALVEAAVAANDEQNVTVSRVLRMAHERLLLAINAVDASTFVYAVNEGGAA